MPILGAHRLSCTCLVAARVHVHRQFDKTVAVSPFVIVPRHELHEGVVEANARLGVEGRRGGVRDEVGGDHLIVGVRHDPLVLRLLAALLDKFADLGVRGRLADHAGQVDDQII